MKSSDDSILTIGQLAARAGLRPSAIRYYEQRGVLPAPTRVSGQRRYGPDAIRRLEVIAAAKGMGLSLDDTRELTDPAALRALAARRLPAADAELARAGEQRARLAAAAACGCVTLDACALFA